MTFKRILTYVIVLLLLILGITFAAINATPITFDYYFGSTEISLSLLLGYTLGLGILLGLLTALFSIMQLKNENRKLKNNLKKAEKRADPTYQAKHNVVEK